MKSSALVRSNDADAAVVANVSVIVPREGLFTKCEFPIRILHVLDRLDLGGTEKTLARLIKGLNPDLFQHSICTLRGTEPAALSWLSDIDITDAGREARGFQFNVLRLARIMKAVRPTIVHSRNWGGIEGALAARCAGVPVVVHSEHGYQMDMMNGLPLRQRAIRHAAYRCANAIFTVSQELRNYHAAQAWWDAGSIGVLHNGVDGDRFSPSKAVSNRIRAELGIERDALVVGYVGRLIALKDVSTLLLAVEKLVPDVPEVHIVVVGSGSELVRLQSQVTGSTLLSQRVCFTGARENVADLLQAMDIFVLPSLMEGMSNTLLEAMATGLPVIASDVGGNPEIVADSGCGYLFQPRDVAGLAEKLAGLLRNPDLRFRFGDQARRRAREVFGLEAMLERYSRFYCELVMRRIAVRQVGNYVWN